MKTIRLDSLTLAQFIDLACGNYDIIAHASKSPKELHETARALIEEYRMITDPTGYKQSVLEMEDASRLKSFAFMFGLLEVCLLTEGSEDEVRDILANDLGRRRVLSMSRKQLVDFVSREKRTYDFRLKRTGDNESPDAHYSEDEIRRGFSSEIAFVMAYFKMSIDVHVISASVYANLVRQARTAAKEAAARK